MAAAIVGPIVTFVLIYIVGHRVAEAWTEARKRRELNMEALNHFFELYGEFFTVWKLWNNLVEDENLNEEVRERRREVLYERAAAAEGQVESFLVRLATQLKLSDEDRDVLGSFRQAYKRLRKAIGGQVRLNWYSSTHPSYAAFKALAAVTASLVADDHVSGFRPHRSMPSRDEAIAALRQVTSNRYEADVWVDVAADRGLLNHSERRPRRPSPSEA